MNKTIAEMSKEYETPKTKNITELGEFNIHEQIRQETFTDTDGKEFTVNKVTINGEDYRIPNSVLKQIKEHLEEKPTLVNVKVRSSGTGLNTTYTVIPLN